MLDQTIVYVGSGSIEIKEESIKYKGIISIHNNSLIKIDYKNKIIINNNNNNDDDDKDDEYDYCENDDENNSIEFFIDNDYTYEKIEKKGIEIICYNGRKLLINVEPESLELFHQSFEKLFNNNKKVQQQQQQQSIEEDENEDDDEQEQEQQQEQQQQQQQQQQDF